MDNTYRIDLRQKLNEQFQFLSNSCEAYDRGDKCEALRIATIIRVLLHDTSHSTSLLHQLNAKQIPLLSTIVGEPTPGMDYFHGLGMAKELSDGSRELIPNLNNFAIPDFMPANEWWEQTVFCLNGNKHVLSRKNIVLNATNKDGGAHVDTNMADAYQALASNGSAGYFLRNINNSATPETAPDMHWVSLRQMGYELLESPELTSLVDAL